MSLPKEILDVHPAKVLSKRSPEIMRSMVKTIHFDVCTLGGDT